MSKRSSPQTQAIDVAVGKRVRLRRQLLNMSQSALAKKIGVTFQQVQKCEQGINRIGAGRLYQIALILEVPVEYFFQDVRDASGRVALPLSAEPAGETDFTNQGVKLVKAFSRIEDAETRRHLAELIDRLSDS